MKRLDVTRVDITDGDIAKALELPSDFGYGGNLPLGETWSLGPMVETRDSTLREQSNCAALKAYLESDPSLADDWQIVGASHWGVGWVEHVAFRAIETDGTPTRIFRVLKAWFDALSEYPVADDADYSRREYEATVENIRDAGRPYVADTAPEDWAEQAFGWFWEHDQRAVESSDDSGGYPSVAQMRACLSALGWLDSE